ncbi:hypothetical protein Scep_022818 [Stephania cephalantha]|uniref:Uncharacterized protein n=1 Tax=Stephania cephalantha TaxID=152367 RepID=A0AAP0I2Y2_9MAGN
MERPSAALLAPTLFRRIVSDFGFVVFSIVANKGKTVEDVMPIATSHDREEIEAEIRVFFHWIDCLFCLRSSQRAMAEVESAKALTLAVST